MQKSDKVQFFSLIKSDLLKDQSVVWLFVTILRITYIQAYVPYEWSKNPPNQLNGPMGSPWRTYWTPWTPSTTLDLLKAPLDHLGPLNRSLDPIGTLRKPDVPCRSSEGPSNVAIDPLGPPGRPPWPPDVSPDPPGFPYWHLYFSRAQSILHYVVPVHIRCHVKPFTYYQTYTSYAMTHRFKFIKYLWTFKAVTWSSIMSHSNLIIPLPSQWSKIESEDDGLPFVGFGVMTHGRPHRSPRPLFCKEAILCHSWL